MSRCLNLSSRFSGNPEVFQYRSVEYKNKDSEDLTS